MRLNQQSTIDLIEIIDNSPSAKFYENPHKFLDEIEKSPIIDEY